MYAHNRTDGGHHVDPPSRGHRLEPRRRRGAGQRDPPAGRRASPGGSAAAATRPPATPASISASETPTGSSRSRSAGLPAGSTASGPSRPTPAISSARGRPGRASPGIPAFPPDGGGAFPAVGGPGSARRREAPGRSSRTVPPGRSAGRRPPGRVVSPGSSAARGRAECRSGHPA